MRGTIKSQLRTRSLTIAFTALTGVGFSFASQPVHVPKADLDPSLINGVKYSFFTPGVKGHQFLNDALYIQGHVTINENEYTNLQLNLDVYNQQLVLRFNPSPETNRLLAISDAWLTSFCIGSQHFEYKALENGSKQIFQVIGKGSVQVLYGWKKRLELDTTNGEYYFTKPNRSAYLALNGAMKRFKGNRSFINSLPEPIKVKVKKYMKANRIRVNNADDSVMERLVDYCNSILA